MLFPIQEKNWILGFRLEKKLNSIYVQWIRRIWNSVTCNTFVGYSIPIKTWICPGFIFYKYFKSSSICNALTLIDKVCVITRKKEKNQGKKETKKKREKKKRKMETFEIIFFLPNTEFAVCFRQFVLNDVRVYKKYLYSPLLLLSRFLNIKCQNQLPVSCSTLGDFMWGSYIFVYFLKYL